MATVNVTPGAFLQQYCHYEGFGLLQGSSRTCKKNPKIGGLLYTLSMTFYASFLLQPTHRIGVAIGTQILDLSVVKHLFNGTIMQHNQGVFDKVGLRNSVQT